VGDEMKSFIQGIKNIIKWFHIIWEDRDFDYGYLLDILEFKLKSMEQFFNSNDTWTKNSKKCAKQIMIVKNLIHRIKREDYLTNKNEKYMVNQDLEYLGLMLRKHLKSWWD
jgi:uncharacterized UPF0160 family protein